MRFVALDGPDGCGKSTIARALVADLRRDHVEVVHLREPGSTRFGERIRAALLDPDCGDLDPLSEALAFSAARRAMLEQEVAPALARGAIVVAERCFLSTVVYQCLAPVAASARAPEDLVRAVTEAVHHDVRHDLVVLLDVDAATALSRATAAAGPDRIEARGFAFHERVRRGFLDLTVSGGWVTRFLRRAGSTGSALEVVDAGRPLDAVVAAVIALVRSRVTSHRGEP